MVQILNKGKIAVTVLMKHTLKLIMLSDLRAIQTTIHQEDT